MIPNIIHFIYFSGPNSRDFCYVNYLAVRSAYEIQKPDKIFIYCNAEPKDNPNWEAVKKYATIERYYPPQNYLGVDLVYPQYQADVARLLILQERGGIYLDTDSLLIRSLDSFRNDSCVMGGESYLDGQRELNDISKLKSVSATPIMAERNNAFVNKWLSRWGSGYKEDVWANHAVMLPLELWKEDKSLVNMQTVEAFVPFDFYTKYIFDNNESDLNRLKDSYAVHMWETWWAEELRKIDDNYMLTQNNLFTKLFKDYIIGD